MDTKSIMFGGKEADIGIALKDTMTVTNTGKARTYSIGLISESRCDSDKRFSITIKPREFRLEKVFIRISTNFLNFIRSN